MTMVRDFNGKSPRIDPAAFIAADAVIIGDVEIASRANVWFHSIIRGDTNYIRIGRNCNIQDACVLHVVKDFHPVILEDDVVLGHRVVIHGCRVEKGALIGIGAVALNGAKIGSESIVGAGSVVSPNTIIPPRTLAVGIPARVVRDLNEEDIRMIRGTVNEYLELMEIYRSQVKGVIV
jgi:carbonic anhydrase/acetyltransferase-like protein (isoleucine patch superfamily)